MRETRYASLNDIINARRPYEKSFYIYETAVLRELYTRWQRELPGVLPHYAVKCNPCPAIISTLADLGANFDCASTAEIDLVLSHGVDPSRILYANPCKRECDLAYALSCGIDLVTFDSISELDKISRAGAKAILRIYANDPTAKCILSNKFGAYSDEWDAILARAKELDVPVVGISFHVGSGACNPQAFTSALYHARWLHQRAKSYGFNLNIIDIGGGFSESTMSAIAPAIREALETYFPPQTKCTFIAEPGRYFAERCATLYTKVIGFKNRKGHRYYTISESIYGSFNCLLYDHIDPKPETYKSPDAPTHPSTIFGATCDGLDTIVKDKQLPLLDIGDYVVWRNMGAYTVAGASRFNGIPFCEVTHYVI